ncbi:DUF5689 domain-containing protein [uncultured Alistipes sp.]|uniref:DUF5689 domain-containing protein n=1 Tax=uncultured Alistipes sp. TaxID=538949 RepID=UPI00263330E1|nr:DUF5689 domain-containing protein [uncultured Alistipes sp.]
MRPIAWLMSSLLLLGAGCNNASSLHYGDGGSGLQGYVSIAYLKSFCRGEFYPITQDVWIEGRVVANDAFGEFPNALVVADREGYGGIEVLIDADHLYRRFERGCMVRIACNGLALADYGGKIQLGANSSSPDYTLDRIPENSLDRYLTRTEDDVVEPIPTVLTFRDVNHSMLDTYVRFDRVRFAQEEIGLPFCDRDPLSGRLVATDRHLVDEQDDTLRVRTAASCVYADDPIPSGTGSLRGILDYFNGNYMVRITDREFDLR